MRLFLAIPLANSVTTALTRLTARLRPAAPDLRWTSSESWHITLQFLGSTQPDQYECLVTRLAALKCPPVTIQPAGLGLFERPGILHLGVEPTSPLLALQQHIAVATTLCGFEQEARAYRPHITLARARGRSTNLRALAARIGSPTSFGSFTALEFQLYESHSSPTGSTYEVRHRFPLTSR
jgi:2'-5' RNA ligase